MKNIAIGGAVLIVILGFLYFYLQPNTDQQTPSLQEQDEVTEDTSRMMNPDTQDEEAPAPGGKLKADTFTGTLESVDTGCYYDAECFVVVDGKHVTVLTSMRLMQQEVGTVQGADGIGGLETAIGQEVEVYAQDNSDGTYTLYGSEGFYVKVLK